MLRGQVADRDSLIQPPPKLTLDNHFLASAHLFNPPLTAFTISSLDAPACHLESETLDDHNPNLDAAPDARPVPWSTLTAC